MTVLFSGVFYVAKFRKKTFAGYLRESGSVYDISSEYYGLSPIENDEPIRRAKYVYYDPEGLVPIGSTKQVAREVIGQRLVELKRQATPLTKKGTQRIRLPEILKKIAAYEEVAAGLQPNSIQLILDLNNNEEGVQNAI